jgi:hypothetical protein
LRHVNAACAGSDCRRVRPDVIGSVSGSVILAHQGGWDEMLMVLGPIGLMAGLLRLAKKRVAARQADDAAADGGPGADPPAAIEGSTGSASS